MTASVSRHIYLVEQDKIRTCAVPNYLGYCTAHGFTDRPFDHLSTALYKWCFLSDFSLHQPAYNWHYRGSHALLAPHISLCLRRSNNQPSLVAPMGFEPTPL